MLPRLAALAVKAAQIKNSKEGWKEGWKCDIRGIKNYDELPAECKAYIEAIEEEIGVHQEL